MGLDQSSVQNSAPRSEAEYSSACAGSWGPGCSSLVRNGNSPTSYLHLSSSFYLRE